MLKGYKDFLALARARKTTYGFNSKDISEKNLLHILEAARWAPSCGNAQPWHFIVVRNKENIQQLISSTHFIHAPFIRPLPPVIVAFMYGL